LIFLFSIFINFFKCIHFRLAQIIILMVGLGVMLGYAIQFYVAIEIIFPSITEASKFAEKHPVFMELIFRSIMVLITFIIAQIVPSLSLLLSLIGSVCCVVLVFVLPTICELMLRHNDENGIGLWCWIKNLIILAIAFAGFCLGGGTAIIQIVESFKFKA
jgi:solute carrier family 36 (proton-coupled amino acid transporter)